MWLFYKNRMIDLNGACIEITEYDKVTDQKSNVTVMLPKGNIIYLEAKHPRVLFEMIQEHLNLGAVGFEVTEKEIQERYNAVDHVDPVEEK